MGIVNCVAVFFCVSNYSYLFYLWTTNIYYDDLFLLSLADRLVDFEGDFDFERVLDLDADVFLLDGAFEEINLELSTNTTAPGTNIHTPFGNTYKRKSVKLSFMI